MKPKPPERLSRPPMHRMLRIHESLRKALFPNATQLAREFEVSEKSIYRDIDFMRLRLNLPVQFNSVRNGYFYSHKVTSFPTIQLTEGELVALVIAEKALQQYRGTSFERPILRALRKIEQSLPETISLGLGNIEQTISFRTRAEPILDLAKFEQLSKATAKREQLQIVYRKPGQKKTERRTIDPYHLANINGEWYLFAFDHLRNDIRTFVPTRIRAILPTGKSFPKPTQFDVAERLRDSFAVHSAEGSFEVEIQFTPEVADYIREKKWHESQKLKQLKNGGVLLTVKLSSLREIQRWVLGWGGEAQVLQPPELIKAVADAAAKLARRHHQQART